MDIDHEISLLVTCLKRICTRDADDGKLKTTFGNIFTDEVRVAPDLDFLLISVDPGATA